jgi:hypothetical protein
MREKLTDRRASTNIAVDFVTAAGSTIKLQVTFGIDASGRVREVFCGNFKAGSDSHALIMDGCVLLSRLMQHNDSLDDLADTLCQPPSYLGTIAKAAAALNKETSTLDNDHADSANP